MTHGSRKPLTPSSMSSSGPTGQALHTIGKTQFFRIFKHNDSAIDFCADQEFIDLLTDNGIKLYMMPEEFEWDGVSPIVNGNMLHQVDVEELLPRKQIMVDTQAIANDIKGKTILITGSAGSIGSEMVRQIANFAPKRLVLIDQAETPQHDIRLMLADKWPELECHTIVNLFQTQTIYVL